MSGEGTHLGKDRFGPPQCRDWPPNPGLRTVAGQTAFKLIMTDTLRDVVAGPGIPISGAVCALLKPIRCALIGVGWWGTSAHMPALLKHAGAELVAVHARQRDKAEKVAADFGVPMACTTIGEVLAIPGLEAVIIATTPNVHFEQARAALEAGLHVLVEKPMTLTLAEARQLEALAQKNGVVLAVACPWHFTAHGLAAREIVRSGRLGQMKMISVLMTNFTLGLYQGKAWDHVFEQNPELQKSAEVYVPPATNSYSDPAVAGGGQIYCQVSHAAAYLSYLTGRQPAEVFARFDNAGMAVDIYDSLSLKLDDGTLVSMASHGATMLTKRHYEVRVYGTEGMILLDLWRGKMEFHSRDCQITRYPDLSEEEIYPLFAPTENFIDAIAGTAPNVSPGEIGVFSMRVIEAAVASAASGRNVIL